MEKTRVGEEKKGTGWKRKKKIRYRIEMENKTKEKKGK